MIKQITKTVTALSITIMAVLAVGNSAAASPTDEEAFGLMLLEVVKNDGTVVSAVLDCPPELSASGHPEAEASCSQLIGANGYVSDIEPASDTACTMHLEPTTVRMTGIWNGEFRQYEETHSNPCVAITTTGGNLFSFIN
ncbi:SSI family serine proteinase inhibitor [Haloglycomyces albus]|uniref:SSI family serine proteinase inhibitor n=1 Tax=Haloglycomyces albus TaxID=526067 RepID=UPI00046D00FE|nr:SSI family serine proteinase inhibitor [Haloglycomyces albus]